MLYKLFSLVSIKDYWAGYVLKRFNLHKVLLPNSDKKSFFFFNNFVISQFKSHFFMRMLWRGKFADSKFLFGKYNYKLLYSKYGFRFLKYLFSIRYSSNILLNDNPYLLNNFYFKIVSFILGSSYKLNSSIYNKLGHRLFNRGQPINNVINFEKKIYWKNKNWNFIVKNISTKKKEQHKRQILITNLYKKFKFETNIKVKKDLYRKIKNLLIIFFSLRKSMIYKMNDKILVKYLRLFFRRKKKNLIKYYKNSIKKLRLKKRNFYLFKNSSKRRVNKAIFNKNFKYESNLNFLNFDSINEILKNNEYINKNKKLSLFIPKTFSSLALYRKKLHSQYFSKWNYSYYLTDKKKIKNLNKLSLFKQSNIINYYSNNYILYLEYYILMFLKRILLIFNNSLSFKYRVNKYYKLLSKFVIFINNYLLSQKINLNKKLLSNNIILNIHDWFLKNILSSTNSYELSNNAKINSNIYLVRKTKLWIFFKFLQNIPLLNDSIDYNSINYLHFNLLNVKLLNWWYCYYSNNNIYNWFIKNLLYININNKPRKLINFIYYYYLNNINQVKFSSFIFLYLSFDWYILFIKKNKKFLIWS